MVYVLKLFVRYLMEDHIRMNDAWDFTPVSIKEIERIINEFKG